MELNAQQIRAVRHDEGPLLIIAGAGTGKTRVITSRIFELIQSKKATSDEILVLTFTDKAMNEMQERIDLEMSLGYEKFHIKTFHAFADEILRQSGLEIGVDPGFKTLTQVEQWFFFKTHLFDFELDYYRPLGNPNRFIYAILGFFSRLKDELISPKAYLEYAERLDGEEQTKILEIARTYEKYQDLLSENNSLDFGDLCFLALKLLNTRGTVLEKYQSHFKYILVDEFQDTNYAQFQLILKLAQKHRNITVVGDDDQSIYKWRGASLSNILLFEECFPGSEKIVLKENYRSTQSILDGAYTLIQNNNPDRLEVKEGIDKHLSCNNGDGEPVAVHQFTDFLQECDFVASKIAEIRQLENLDFSDFAILVRTNQQAYTFIDELKLKGIPYQVKNPKGLFALDEIKDLIAVARFLANPADDISLLRILKMDVFDFGMAEILELLNNGRSLSLYKKMLKDEPNLSMPGFESPRNFIAAILRDLIEFSKRNPIGLTVNEFIQKSGLLKYLIERDKFEELENINEFAKQVGRFERENDFRSVIDFVNYLDLLDQANAVFSTQSFAERNCVQILTAHGAKGLEFPYVFIVNAVAQRFPGTRRSEIFEVPDELTKEIYPEGDFHLQEERRLFYVAMTRAKKQLFICYSETYEGAKKWKASPFVQEVLKSERSILVMHESTEDAVKRLQYFRQPNKPIFDLPKLTSKKFSFTQLDTFKYCPLKYNYRYLMKVPVPMAHASSFGISVHETLKEFYRLLKSGEMVTVDLLKKLYDKNWVAAGYESMEHESMRREKGWDVLKVFYEKNSSPWVIPLYLERPFTLKIGNYWINGRIDRIDRLVDGGFEVIDYKTGHKKEDNLKKDLQLSLYALACRDIFGIKAERLSLYYLEDNEKVTTERNDADLAKLREEILALIDVMMKSDFSPTPGFHCQFCDFRLICPAV